MVSPVAGDCGVGNTAPELPAEAPDADADDAPADPGAGVPESTVDDGVPAPAVFVVSTVALAVELQPATVSAFVCLGVFFSVEIPASSVRADRVGSSCAPRMANTPPPITSVSTTRNGIQGNRGRAKAGTGCA